MATSVANQTVDISVVLNALMQVAASVLLALGSWAVARLIAWLNLKNGAQISAAFDDALAKSVTYGLQQAQETIRQKGWDHPDVRNQALAAAIPYAIQRFPDALTAAGIDLSSANVELQVRTALDRAFPAAAAQAAASPATPPLTAPNTAVPSAPPLAAAA